MIVFEDIKCISSILKKILWDFSTGTKRWGLSYCMCDCVLETKCSGNAWRYDFKSLYEKCNKIRYYNWINVFRAMGKSIDIAFDLLKVCSYFAIGGSCFYLLSGGKLPFQVTFLPIVMIHAFRDRSLTNRLRAGLSIKKRFFSITGQGWCSTRNHDADACWASMQRDDQQRQANQERRSESI